MKILTEQHKYPPRLLKTPTGYVSSDAIIKQGNIQRMTTLGLYRHNIIGPGPYTEWSLMYDQIGPLFIQETRELTEEEKTQKLENERASLNITRLQARLVLIDLPDISNTYNNAWEAIHAWANTQDNAVKAFFEDAQHWNRLDPNVLLGSKIFGWDDIMLDNLFKMASER
jgi:hypothetical protein